MLFNSYEFLAFFFLVTALFYSLQHKYHWPMLLAASCYFYMVFVPRYILILLVLIVVDYVAGILIAKSKGLRRKTLLILSLISNIGMLAFFKYFNFAENEVARVASWLNLGFHPTFMNVVLPIGLSFHTFQSMAYTIEVYRGREAERHFGIYSLYVLFYPQLVAGPIERPQNLLPQFHSPVAFDYRRAASGLELMLWGLFKKVVVADNLAVLVDGAYEHPATVPSWGLLLGTYAYAMQIYCDFSGYTDIARGAARVMGFHLMRNFDAPYHSRSISEFWHRWHISLSSWFRDYLYIPLGGNRLGIFRTYVNIFVVFVVSGLWHGASLTFVFWGALHGFYFIFGRMTKKWRERIRVALRISYQGRIHRFFAILITFHLVLFAWIFFRAPTFHRALEVIQGILSLQFKPWSMGFQFGAYRIFGVVAGLVILLGLEVLHATTSRPDSFRRSYLPIRVACCFGAIALVLLWGRFESRDFIYFQF